MVETRMRVMAALSKARHDRCYLEVALGQLVRRWHCGTVTMWTNASMSVIGDDWEVCTWAAFEGATEQTPAEFLEASMGQGGVEVEELILMKVWALEDEEWGA